MAYASRLGRARINPSSPQAAAVCDRCGFVLSHSQLGWQMDWMGAKLGNKRLLVCSRCMDRPQEQLRAIIIPADPMPVIQPRTQDYLTAEGGNSPVLGIPDNIDINAVMPLSGTTHYRVQLSPLSITANGTTTVAVTFSSAHGLSTNDQIVVQGVAHRYAAGAYSVTVTSAVAFSYVTAHAVPAGPMLTGTTLMVTANIGLPLGATQIPQV